MRKCDNACVCARDRAARYTTADGLASARALLEPLGCACRPLDGDPNQELVLHHTPSASLLVCDLLYVGSDERGGLTAEQWADPEFWMARNFNRQYFHPDFADGKIPVYSKWKDRLASGEIGMDALMNLSAFYSFASDQEVLDARIESLI